MSSKEIYSVVWGQKKRPDHLTYLGIDGLHMTNYDHSIDEGLQQALTETPSFAVYSAQDFSGMVWFEEGQFHCEVWVFHAHVATVSADTLEEIMAAVCDRYGDE